MEFAALLSLQIPRAYALEAAPAHTQQIAALSELDQDDKTELSEFYALRANQRLWDLSNPAAQSTIQNLIATLENWIAYHGLNRSDYPLQELAALAANPQSDEAKLEHLTVSGLLRLAHDLHGDYIDLAALYTGWTFHRAEKDFVAPLHTALTTGPIESFFEPLAPHHAAYTSLAKALSTYIEIEEKGGWPTIEPGASLRKNDTGKRVAQLRARLVAEGYPAHTSGNPRLFDTPLAQALTSYQLRNGLAPDGRAGAKTVEELNTPVAERLEQIRANMERWRQMPDGFPPSRHITVNIPAFTVSVHDEGAKVYTGAVVVGRQDRPTPFINSQIVNAVINPKWHVPKRIAREDILPKLQNDPLYLERQGVVIKGRDQDPSGTTIDWDAVSPENFTYALVQAPGELNSLGRLKFNFPNPFDVYMHGTPHQEHFKKPKRDYSSGCVRMEEPLRVGELLLKHNKDNGGWNDQRIATDIDSGKTRIIVLAKPIPVFFQYWTVFVDDSRQLNFRKDLYGYDQLLARSQY